MLFQKDQIKINSNMLTCKHDLVFCDQLKFCNKENAKFVLFYQVTNQNLRSSSPTKPLADNFIYLQNNFQVDPINNLMKSSDILCVTKAFPNHSMIQNALDCTSDTKIFIQKDNITINVILDIYIIMKFVIFCISINDTNNKQKL